MIPQPEREALDKAEYWLIKTTAMEWLFLLQKIINGVKRNPDEHDFVVLIQEDGGWLYMLKRNVFPIDLVSKTLGVRESLLVAGKVLVLDAPKANANLPKPTVNYYGEA